MSNFVLFERQPDGTYTRKGELPKGTRYAVVTHSATVPGTRGVVKRVNEWEEVLTRGPLKQEWYKLMAVESPHPMTDAAKEKLQALNVRKKKEATEDHEEHS